MKPSELDFREYKEKATNWAKERINDPKTVILDLETTGLPSKNPEVEICQISMINVEDRPLLSMLVKPKKPVPEDVIKIHGITNEQLEDQPGFIQIAKLIKNILKGKHIVCYNSGFDIKILWSLFKRNELNPPEVESISCAMEKYSEYRGQWNDSKNSFKWHKLPSLSYGKAHDALTDCASTLKLMRIMAGEFDPDGVKAEEISLDF